MPDSQFVSSAIVVFLLAYLVGCTPCGFLIGKFNGVDIRRHGSCNIGATNVRRILGRDWGLLCFLLDFFKGYLAVLLLGHSIGSVTAVGFEWGGIFAAFGTVLGHVYPCWLNFKGGKGVATSLGAVLGVAFWPVLMGGIFWLLAFLRHRIVSVASMVAGVAMALTALIMRICGSSKVHWPAVLLLVVLAVLIVYRHKENIQRLRNGKELAFGKIRR
jgi:glycerol-3-phosphate acyltransferase PlsY